MPEQWTSSLTAKSRRFKEGQKGTEKLWTPDSHVGEEIGVKTVVYNTKRDQKKRKKKEQNKKKKRAKCWKNTTVKRKNSVLSIILLGHDREYFLYLCMCNSFLLILSSNIFSLDSDLLFLPLSTNLLFGLFGPESISILGSSQNRSLQNSNTNSHESHQSFSRSLLFYFFFFNK